MLTLTFLGTSSGVPTKQRNLTALALQTGQGRSWWLIDCGEATQHRLQHTGLSMHDLDGICITHVHGDHSYGLPGLLASAAMSGRTRPLTLIATQAIRAWLDATMLHTTLTLNFPLVFVDVDAQQEVHRAEHQDGCLTIERHCLSHRVPSVGFRFAVEQHQWKLDVAALRALGVAPGEYWGRLQRGEDVTLADGTVLEAARLRTNQVKRATVVVGGDNDTPDLLEGACKDAQLLIHESTYTEAILQKVGPGPTHSSAMRVAQFAARCRLPNLILTHFSPRYEEPLAMAELEAEARANYSGVLFLAHDFARFGLDAEGVLTPLGQAN